MAALSPAHRIKLFNGKPLERNTRFHHVRVGHVSHLTASITYIERHHKMCFNRTNLFYSNACCTSFSDTAQSLLASNESDATVEDIVSLQSEKYRPLTPFTSGDTAK